MVVKDKIGRNRYILFIAEGGEKKNIVSALNKGKIKLRLILYNGKHGIVKCKHTDKEEAVKFLNRLKINGMPIKTLKTSGTIKKLKRHINQ
ncbi:MAG TPA: hypothetical protein ENI33_01210 [Thermoplasmatales archaeon]|nr:hypothetical protein [Thermoplasmatales archaeon]HEC88919.1 hypothetical protein [Thermoplasmata archaeon]